jgi:hypothetical protein
MYLSRFVTDCIMLKSIFTPFYIQPTFLNGHSLKLFESFLKNKYFESAIRSDRFKYQYVHKIVNSLNIVYLLNYSIFFYSKFLVEVT